VPVDAPADAVLTAVRHVEEAVERRVEAARVEQLLTAALGHGPGVLGLKDTLTAVVEGGVLILVVEEDFAHPGFECPNCGYLSMTEAPRCPLCDHEVDAQADVVERAGERALEEDGALEVLRGENRAALAGYGHIGALLRYRPAM
jgi:peptide subunit release factor 1 (eRF1)